MSFDLATFKETIKSAFKQLNKDQAEILSIQIAANFIAGQSSAKTHTSFNTAEKSAISSDSKLSKEDKAAIAGLSATFLGYLSAFNETTQNQILDQVQAIVDQGGDSAEVQEYLDSIFDGEETIEINNVGQERKDISVDKNLKLSEVTRTVENSFFSTVNSYAWLMGTIVAHTAFEAGRKSQYQKSGLNQWVFSGPSTGVRRASHVAILGTVYTYGTNQSDYAEQCLGEPHCHHKAEAYFNDPDKDTSQEDWQKLKDDAGLEWDQEKKEWKLK